MFILPVQVRWLALFTWILYGYQFLVGNFTTKALVFASVANYFLFFGRDIFLSLRQARRRMELEAKTLQEQHEVKHRCTECGITDKSHPDADFRYCSKCAEPTCYCHKHIRKHRHTTVAETPAELE